MRGTTVITRERETRIQTCIDRKRKEEKGGGRGERILKWADTEQATIHQSKKRTPRQCTSPCTRQKVGKDGGGAQVVCSSSSLFFSLPGKHTEREIEQHRGG